MLATLSRNLRLVGLAFGCGLCLAGAPRARAAAYTWQTIDSPPNTLYAAMVVQEGRLYLLGGSLDNNAGANQLSRAVWEYDPAVGQPWTLKGASLLPYGIIGINNAPVIADGVIVQGPTLGPTINGGWGTHNRMIEYDLAANQATQTAAYPAGSNFWTPAVAATQVGGQTRVYSFGGWNGSGVDTIYSYSITADTLTPLTARLTSPGVRQIVAVDDQGDIIVAGGNTSGTQGRVEIFDPVQEAIVWSGDNLPAGLRNSQGFSWTSPQGDVYMGCTATRQVYEFDPVAHSFTDVSADFAIPVLDAGYLRGNAVYDPTYHRIYVEEGKWNGTQWDSRLQVGSLVPEPGAVALLLAGGLLLLGRRRVSSKATEPTAAR